MGADPHPTMENNMSYSYSHQLATHIKESHDKDPTNVLFAVASLCVDRDIVPAEIATRVGVSKQAVYDWLQLKYAPKPEAVLALAKYLKELKATKKSKKA